MARSPHLGVGVGVGESAFRGVQPCRHGRPPLDRDGSSPALVEVPNREDAVFLIGLAEGVLDVLEELGQPRRRNRSYRLPQGIERQGGHGDQRLVAVYLLGRHPRRLPSSLESSNSITAPGPPPQDREPARRTLVGQSLPGTDHRQQTSRSEP